MGLFMGVTIALQHSCTNTEALNICIGKPDQPNVCLNLSMPWRFVEQAAATSHRGGRLAASLHAHAAPSTEQVHASCCAAITGLSAALLPQVRLTSFLAAYTSTQRCPRYCRFLVSAMSTCRGTFRLQGIVMRGLFDRAAVCNRPSLLPPCLAREAATQLPQADTMLPLSALRLSAKQTR